MPVPIFYANSTGPRRAARATGHFRGARYCAAGGLFTLVGIGEARPSGSLVQTGLIRPDEVVELKRVGVAAGMLGVSSMRMETSPKPNFRADRFRRSLKDLRGRDIAPIAGGPSKVVGIRAALASGFLKRLITDEPAARRLANEQSVVVSDNKNSKSRRVKTQQKGQRK